MIIVVSFDPPVLPHIPYSHTQTPQNLTELGHSPTLGFMAFDYQIPYLLQ